MDEAKIHRHQIAKEKYKTYQRAQSSNKSGSTGPTPGQFVLTLPNIKITKNIKLILQDKNISPSIDVIYDVVNTKLNNQSMKNITNTYVPIRPISAQIYQHVKHQQKAYQSTFIQQASEFDQQYYHRNEILKKNSFVVRSKHHYPRYLQGYNSINIHTQHQIQPQEIPPINHQHQPHQNNTKFLPIEYYLIDQEQPSTLMHRYKCQQIVYGYSKWYNLDGKCQWKKCKVLQYKNQMERWEIEWLENAKTKYVSRNNLRFELQDQQQFQRRVNNAQKYRCQSEAYLKYNYMIDLLDVPTHSLDNHQINKIVELTINDKIKTILKSKQSTPINKKLKISLTNDLNKLIQQTKNLYIRANHQAIFNASLPYDETLRIQFEKYLPKYLFKPNQQTKIIKHSTIIRNKELTNSSKELFVANLNKIKEKSCLNNKHRLNILETLNKIQQEFNNKRFIEFIDFKILMNSQMGLIGQNAEDIGLSFDQFIQNAEKNMCQIFYLINCRICDIEHFIGIQLDPLYVDKKNIGYENFDKIINNYKKFLYLVDYRLQNVIRTLYCNTLTNLITNFQESLLGNENTILAKFTNRNQFNSIKIPVRIKLSLTMKDNKLIIHPLLSNIKLYFSEMIDNLFKRILDLNCVSKSYIDPIRPKNKLRALLTQLQDSQQVRPQIKQLNTFYQQEILKLYTKIDDYIDNVTKIVTNINNLNNEAKKKMQKKNNYKELEQIIDMINNINDNIKISLNSSIIYIGIFVINVEQIMDLCKLKINQVTKEVYKMLLQRVNRQNEKIEKSIEQIIQKLQKQPSNIEQMIELDEYTSTIIQQQLQKINEKVNLTAEKVELLQRTNHKIDYKDFQSCYRIYVKPLKVKKKRAQCLRQIDNIYKKIFGQQLTKQTINLLQEIKQYEQSILDCKNIKRLQQMDALYLVYSRLHQRIQASINKMKIINSRQQAMKWKQTNFSNLLVVNETFQPYFKLIMMSKNFRYRIQSQKYQPLMCIDGNMISQQVEEACETLQHLQKHTFLTNFNILPVVTEVLDQYNCFKVNLPIIKALKNPDLRDRHWNRIKKITNFIDIQSQSVTLEHISNTNINSHIQAIKQVSDIATKQLVYQKQLNRLKKQWKQVRIITKCFQHRQFHRQSQVRQNTNQSQQITKEQPIISITKKIQQKFGKRQSGPIQSFKIISNLRQIHTKVESDIFNIQNILASSFIKFLEVDIVAFRNSILYKAYQFIQTWQKIQRIVIPIFGIFLNKRTQNQISPQYNKFKAIQKAWKGMILQIESQSNIVEILQTKIIQNLKYIEENISGLYSEIYEFFNKKKQTTPQLSILSNEQLLQSFSTVGDYKLMDNNIMKCFTGIFNLGRKEQQKQKQSGIGQIITKNCQFLILEKIVTQILFHENQIEYVLIDEIVDKIDKGIKNKLSGLLRKSWEQYQYQSDDNHEINNIENIQFPEKSILNQNSDIEQISLLKHRIVFTSKTQHYLQNGIDIQQYLIELIQRRNLLIKFVQNNSPKLNHQNLLYQLSSQITIIEKLMQNGVNNVFNFQWQSQVRSYIRMHELKNQPQVLVSVGTFVNKYGFNLINSRCLTLSYNDSRMFFSICMALRQRQFPLVKGQGHSGKTTLITYLGELMGRQVNIFQCNNLWDSTNLIDCLRLSTSGMWVVIKHINLLSQQFGKVCLSALQMVWSQIKMCQKKCSTSIFNTNLYFIPEQLGLFGTFLESNTQNRTINKYLSNSFRIMTIIKPSYDHIVKTKLLGTRFSNEEALSKIMLICNQVKECIKLLRNRILEKQTQKKISKDIDNKKNVSFIPLEKKCSVYTENIQAKSYLTNLTVQSYYHNFDQLTFLNKIVSAIQNTQYANVSTKLLEDKFLQLSISKVIKEYFLDFELVKSILQHMKSYFQFNIQVNNLQAINSTEIQESNILHQEIDFQGKNNQKYQQQIKDFLLTQKLYCNNQIVTQFQNLIISIIHNRTVVVVNQQPMGKSTIIQSLGALIINNFSISLKTINSLALSPQSFHGKNLSSKNNQKHPQAPIKGVFNSLLKTVLEQQNQIPQKQMKKYNGIIIDGNPINEWFQPLIPLLENNSTRYIQPNGNSVSIPSNFRIIVQATSLESISPNVLHKIRIVPLNINLKWQNTFNSYIYNKFGKRYYYHGFISFIELLVPFIIDPVIEFYQNTFTLNQSGCKQSIPFICPIDLLSLILKLFKNLLDDYFPGDKTFQIIQRQKSDIFNLLVFAIVWSVGSLMQEDTKKTFSRHFKYQIKRAVQVNIRGVEKQSLPNDQHFIYDIYYKNGKWQRWEDTNPNNVANGVLLAPHTTHILYIFNKYLNSKQSLFLIGKPSSSKNFTFKLFLDSLSRQKYLNLTISFCPNSSSSQLQSLITKQVYHQKHSELFQGFVSSKVTLIYICDMNLPTVSEQGKDRFGGFVQFLRSFYNLKGWYLKDSDKLYLFKNLAFYGTLNSQLEIPKRILRHINPLLTSPSEDRAESILKYMIQKQCMNLNNTVKQICKGVLVKCSINFHAVVSRQFGQQCQVKLVFKDIVRVCLGVVRMLDVDWRGMVNKTQRTEDFHMGASEASEIKNSILKKWIYETEAVYSQKKMEHCPEKLYYLINNILMEEERVRYKALYPDKNILISNFNTKGTFQQLTITQLKQIIREVTHNHYMLDITDNLVKNLVVICNSFTNQSPIAICINDHHLNITTFAKIICYLRDRLLLRHQVNAKNYIDGKIQWREFVGDRLEEAISNYEDVLILVESQASDGNDEYIIDDLLSLRRINIMKSVIRINDQKEIEENQQIHLINNSNHFVQNNITNAENVIATQKFINNSQMNNQSTKKRNHIQVILHHRKFNKNFFQKYQTLLSQSSVLWMTDHIEQSYYSQKIISMKVLLEKYIQSKLTSNHFKQTDTKEVIQQYYKSWAYIQAIHKQLSTTDSIKGIQNHLKYKLLISSYRLFNKIYVQLLQFNKIKIAKSKAIIEKYQLIYAKQIQLIERLERANKSIAEAQNSLTQTNNLISYEQKQYNYFKQIHNQALQLYEQKEKIQLQYKSQYDNAIEQQRTYYNNMRQELCQIVSKEKKIVVTGQLKILLELLAIALGKKKDTTEETIKQMIKQLSNTKLNKKINNVEPYNFSYKAYQKIKLQLEKMDKNLKKNNNKDNLLNQTQLLCTSIKNYLQSLLKIFIKHQSLEQVWIKIAEIKKQVQVYKNDLEKKIKNKNYIQLIQKYDKLSQIQNSQLNKIQIQSNHLKANQQAKLTLKYFRQQSKNQYEIQKNKLQSILQLRKSISKGALLLSLKICYQGFLNQPLNLQFLQNLSKNKNKQFYAKKEQQLFISGVADIKFQDIWTKLNDQIDSQIFSKITNINCKSKQLKELLHKLGLINGIVLLQSSKYHTKWITQILGQELQLKNIINDIKNKGSNANNLQKLQQYGHNKLVLIKVNSNKQLKSFLELQQIWEQYKITLVLMNEDFSMFNKCSYPYVSFKQLPYQQILLLCESMLEGKKQFNKQHQRIRQLQSQNQAKLNIIINNMSKLSNQYINQKISYIYPTQQESLKKYNQKSIFTKQQLIIIEQSTQLLISLKNNKLLIEQTKKQQQKIQKQNYSVGKIVKFCSRFYYGIYHLYKIGVISCLYTLQKYLISLKNIVQKDKQKNASKIRNNKFEQFVKRSIFSEFICQDVTRKNGMILNIFMLAATFDNWKTNFEWILLEIAISFLLNHTLKQKATTNDQTSYLNENNLISKQFQQILRQVSISIKQFEPIAQDILNNQTKWLSFLVGLNERTSRLPEPFQDYSKVYIIFFMIFFKFSMLQPWLLNFPQYLNLTKFDTKVTNFKSNQISPQLPILVSKSQNIIKRLLTLNRIYKVNTFIIITPQPNFILNQCIQNSLKFIVELSQLLKKTLTYLYQPKNKKNLTLIIEQTIKNGNWLYIKSNCISQEMVNHIKQVQQKVKQSGIWNIQYVLWIELNKQNHKQSQLLKFTNQVFQNSFIVRLIDDCYHDISSTYYDIISLSKKSRKQYDQNLSEIGKIYTFSTLQLCKLVRQNQQLSKNFNHFYPTTIFIQLSQLISFQNVNSLVEDNFNKRKSQSNIGQTSIRKYIEKSLYIPTDVYMDCLRQYYFKGMLNKDIYSRVLNKLLINIINRDDTKKIKKISIEDISKVYFEKQISKQQNTKDSQTLLIKQLCTELSNNLQSDALNKDF